MQNNLQIDYSNIYLTVFSDHKLKVLSKKFDYNSKYLYSIATIYILYKYIFQKIVFLILILGVK